MADVLRRTLIEAALTFGMSGMAKAATVTLPFENGERPLVAYPQKRPLIRLTARPPQLETPFGVYDEGVLTPNDAFFVRYHLANAPPQELDAATFTLSIKGRVDRPLVLSLADLKAMPTVDLVAVNQCSGNGRGFSEPRVGGGQAANGLMGNARWRGVTLKAVLARAGVQKDAVQIRFDGMDGPVMAGTPDFAKALDVDHALDGEVMLAWGMNGADLPILNGFPLRLIVPGWYGTYWVKHVNEITVLDKPLDNFWMSTAYRVPDNACACVPPGTSAQTTRPIGKYNVRSFITNLADGVVVEAGRNLNVRGIAFDGGSGIAEVQISTDGGVSWSNAALGHDLGKYSFRPWNASVRLPKGRRAIKVRAVARSGEAQPLESLWNPAGYMRNGVETVTVEVA